MQFSLELTRSAPEMPREARLWSVVSLTSECGWDGERMLRVRTLTVGNLLSLITRAILRNGSDAVN
jgi:hypothetical protein